VYSYPSTVSGFDGPDATYTSGQYTSGTEVQTFALTTETPAFASTTTLGADCSCGADASPTPETGAITVYSTTYVTTVTQGSDTTTVCRR